MPTPLKPFLTPEEYLEIERKAEFKSEYFGAEMLALAGASRAHNIIARNLNGQLYQQLRERPCQSNFDLRGSLPLN